MLSKRLFNILAVMGLILVLMATTLIVACAQPAPKPVPAPTPTPSPAPAPTVKAVELKVVSFLPAMGLKSKVLKDFCDKVTEASKGELSIKFLGGPEVMGPLEQGQGVARGVVDMSMIPPAFISGGAPEVVLPLLSRITQEEEVKRGIIDKLQPFYNKAGLYCLGEPFGNNDPQFIIFTTAKKIEKPEQLNGMTIGGSGAMMKPVADALGFGLKTMPISEVYTALDRKLIEGYMSPAGGLLPFGAQEKLKYAIDHPVFPDYVVLIMNPDKWKSLSPNQQNTLKDTLLKMAPEMGRLNSQDELTSREAFKKAGVEFVKFSPADAEKYVNTMYDALWKEWVTQMPQVAPEFKKLLSP